MMNEIEQRRWERIRKQGWLRYAVKYTLAVSILFFLFDAILGSGYTLLVKQQNWAAYLDQLNWRKLLMQGMYFGLILGVRQWERYKKQFNA